MLLVLWRSFSVRQGCRDQRVDDGIGRRQFRWCPHRQKGL